MFLKDRSNIRKRINIFLSIFILIFFISGYAYAHQPRITSDIFTEIKNPETSQAFYGELKGQPDTYSIESEKSFHLYVGILVPDIEGIEKDISAEIYFGNEKGNDNFLYKLDGLKYKWTSYYEEFGGDNYYFGPEFKDEAKSKKNVPKGIKVEKGSYLIKVFSPDNKGKYVLVVGEKEEFPVNEAINAVKTMPKLKSDFFNKSPLTSFFNIIGLFLLISVVILLAVLLMVFLIVKKLFFKKR